MTREVLFKKMKDLPNPPCRINLIQQVWEIMNSETEELKKENAELKEKNKMLEQGYVWHDYDAGEDCYEDSHEGKWVKRDEIYKLTRAKELIGKLIDDYIKIGSTWVDVSLVKKAEQFLKEG